MFLNVCCMYSTVIVKDYLLVSGLPDVRRHRGCLHKNFSTINRIKVPIIVINKLHTHLYSCVHC